MTPWPGSMDPKACNGNNQLDEYPSDINYCRQMDQPSANCENLCDLCFNQCTSVENGYMQFYVQGGGQPAQCVCTVLKKAPASQASVALSAAAAVGVVAAAVVG